MSEPTDEELLKFVATFVDHPRTRPGYRDVYDNDNTALIPDYLNSVDAFIRDVVPKMNQEQEDDWVWEFDRIVIGSMGAIINGSARSRCLALYRALDGKLPGGES